MMSRMLLSWLCDAYKFHRSPGNRVPPSEDPDSDLFRYQILPFVILSTGFELRVDWTIVCFHPGANLTWFQLLELLEGLSGRSGQCQLRICRLPMLNHRTGNPAEDR